MLRIGAWFVNPTSSQISRNGETTRLDVRAMRLLLCLAEHPGEVVSIDDLLNQVWPGVHVAPDSVYHAVASLRRLLGDDPKQPTYIATVPRLGYRMVADVQPLPDASVEASLFVQDSSQTNAPAGSLQLLHQPSSTIGEGLAEPPPVRYGLRWVPGAILLFSLAFPGAWLLLLHTHATHATDSTLAAPHIAAHPPARSIAVLPFLDLTQGMTEEEFADGMTEELIDQFSKVPGFHVPAPTASFYFKGKKVPTADIAKALHVGYVLDGSVRRSGARLRVAIRLFCADSGFVIWSETYDRPFNDALTLQDDIAREVTKAMEASISTGSHGK
jgi:TolB-like protein/DNA-binding winged helix-turn-helix (wHTH) protein